MIFAVILNFWWTTTTEKFLSMDILGWQIVTFTLERSSLVVLTNILACGAKHRYLACTFRIHMVLTSRNHRGQLIYAWISSYFAINGVFEINRNTIRLFIATTFAFLFYRGALFRLWCSATSTIDKSRLSCFSFSRIHVWHEKIVCVICEFKDLGFIAKNCLATLCSTKLEIFRCKSCFIFTVAHSCWTLTCLFASLEFVLVSFLSTLNPAFRCLASGAINWTSTLASAPIS